MTISATTQGIKPGVCTSTNRPSAPFDGQVIYMTDVDQTAVWDGTQWTVLAPIAGGRNAIINGGMDIYQRGSISAAGYALDRWYFSTYGTSWNSLSVTQQTSGAPTNFRYYMRVAAGSATSTNISFGQSLETHNVIKLAGKVVNLSFYYRVNTNFSTAFTVTPVFTTGTDANISTVPNGTAIGSSQTVTNTTAWTRFSYSFTVPSNATSFAIQFWNNGNTVSTASLDITGVQLEAGAVATPFEFEDYGTTLAKCQRYYQRHVDPVGNGVSNGGPVRMLFPFHTQMRVVPTTGISGTMYYYNGAGTTIGTTINASYNTINHAQLDMNATIGSNGQAVVMYSIGGSQYLDFSAEL